MSPSTVELLRDIFREAEFLSAQAAQTTCEAFLENEVLKRAFVRSVEIIGEATKKVPEETRLQFPALEWKKMAGMRDRLIPGGLPDRLGRGGQQGCRVGDQASTHPRSQRPVIARWLPVFIAPLAGLD